MLAITLSHRPSGEKLGAVADPIRAIRETRSVRSVAGDVAGWATPSTGRSVKSRNCRTIRHLDARTVVQGLGVVNSARSTLWGAEVVDLAALIRGRHRVDERLKKEKGQNGLSRLPPSSHLASSGPSTTTCATPSNCPRRFSLIASRSRASVFR